MDIEKIDKFLEEAKEKGRKHIDDLGKKVIITADPTPAQMKNWVSVMDSLYTDIKVTLANAKTLKSRFESLISVTEKAGSAGTNADMRRSSGIQAARRYQTGADADGNPHVIDLYSKLEDINSVYNLYDTLADIIDKKHQRLILDSGIMKVEITLTQQ